MSEFLLGGRTFLFLLFLLIIIHGCTLDSTHSISLSESKEHNAFSKTFNLLAIERISGFIVCTDSLGTNYYSDTTRGKDFSLTLINLSPNTSYNYSFLAKDDKGNYKEENSGVFRTRVLKDPIIKFNKPQTSNYSFSGRILLRRFFKNGGNLLINDEAEIVWYNDLRRDVPRAFSPTKDETIISILDSGVVIEEDLRGNVINKFELKDEDKPHHEVLKEEKNRFVFLTYSRTKINVNKEIYEIKGDGILIVDSLGRTIWRWSIFDHANPLNDKGVLDKLDDWGHANAISIGNDSSYYISFRDFNQIWKISSVSGKVLWKLGAGGDFKMEANTQFIGQHSIKISENGSSIIMFDNGSNELRPYSRVLSLKLDEKSLECSLNISINLPKKFTSYRMSSAYMIDDEHILVCTSKKRVFLTIYNVSGDIVWETMGDNSSFRAYYLDNFN